MWFLCLFCVFVVGFGLVWVCFDVLLVFCLCGYCILSFLVWIYACDGGDVFCAW